MERQHTPRPLPARLLLTLPLLTGLWACGPSQVDQAEALARAGTAFQRGNLQAAALDLKNVLTAAPDDPDARLLLGRIYLEMGNGGAADKELRRARSLGVAPERIAPLLGRAMLLERRYRPLLEEITIGPYIQADQYAEIMAVRGQAHLRLGQYQEAWEAFTDGLARDENSLNVLIGMFMTAIQEGDLGRAGRFLARAEAQSPDDLSVLLARSELALRHQDYAGAEESYRQALEVRPQNLDARLGLARTLLALNRHDEVEETLQPVMRAMPNHPDPHYLLALSAFLEQDYNQARIHALRVVDTLQPDHLNALFLAGASHYALGETEQAYQQLKRLVNRVPDSVQIRQMLAETQLTLGHHEEAVATIDQMTRQAVGNSELLGQVGAFLVRSGQFAMGKDLLERAVGGDASQASARARALLGEARLFSGERETGLNDLFEAVEQNPWDLQPAVKLVLELIRDQKMDQALDRARAVQERMPHNPVGHLLVGLIHGLQGQGESARAAFQRALAQDPGNADASLNLAAFAMQAGELGEAARLLDEALEYHPDHLQLALKRAGVEELAGRRPEVIGRLRAAVKAHPDHWQPQAMLARRLLEERPGEALVIVEAALLNHPRSFDLLELQAMARTLLGQLPDAEAIFIQLVSAHGNNPRAYYRLGEFYSRQGRWDRAEEAMNRALEIDHQLFLPRLERALARHAQGKFEASRADADLLAGQQPDHPVVNRLRGQLALEQGDFPQAAEHLGRALAREDATLTVNLLARALAAGGRHQDAVDALEEWLVRYPDDQVSRAGLANLHQGQGQWQRAEALYRQVAEALPMDAVTRNNLAWVLMNQGRLEEARQEAEKALELAPRDGRILDTLAMILVEQGETDRALELLRQVIAQWPAQPVFQVHLAKALDQAGESGRAREVLRTVRADAPDYAATDPLMRELLDRLGQ